MDINEMVREAEKIKAVLFAKWLNETYEGHIFGIDYEAMYPEFEKWYQKEVVPKNAEQIAKREY